MRSWKSLNQYHNMEDDKKVAASQLDTQEGLKQRLLAAEARILKLKSEKRELKTDTKEVSKEDPTIEKTEEEIKAKALEIEKAVIEPEEPKVDLDESQKIIEELKAVNEELIKSQLERNNISNVGTGAAIDEDPPTGNTRSEEQAWKEMSFKKGWDDSYKQIFLNNYRTQNGSR